MKTSLKISFLLSLSAATLLSSCKKDVYGCMDPLSSNYNSKATIDNGSCYYAPGQLTVWSSTGTHGSIDVYVDGNLAGTLTSYFTSNPGCAASGTAIINPLAYGSHIVHAVASDATTWDGTVNIPVGSCIQFQLSN